MPSNSREAPASGARRVLVAVLLVGASAAYLAGRADRGWFPHDEGYLGQSAERVLRGELPHRDFDDVYTGGLAMLDAASFRVLGVDLVSLRWQLLAFFLACTAASYFVACRFAGDWTGAFAVAVSVAWSLPVYFASLSSWYVVFFAVFGTWALLRFVEGGGRGWLLVAGCCGGASLLVKSAGLFFLVAAGFGLAYHEQLMPSPTGARRTRSRAWGALLIASLVAFCGALAALVSNWPGVVQAFQFVVPGAALSAFLVWHEIGHGPAGSFRDRARRAASLALPFLCGVALPVGVFLVPYLRTDALADLWRGLVVLPRRRFEYATAVDEPSLTQLVAGLPVLLLVVAGPVLRRAPRRLRERLAAHPRAEWLPVAGIAAVAAWVLRHGVEPTVWNAVWNSVYPLIPLLTVTGCLALAIGGRAHPSPRRQQVFVLLSVAGLVSVVQFPFNSEVYFAYVAALVPPLLLAVLCVVPGGARRALAAAGLFYLAFAGWCVHRSWGDGFEPLGIPRAQLRVAPGQAREYRQVVEVVERNSAPGSAIYATPDAPEIYFLCRRRNPTRTFFDFFEPDYENPRRRADRLMRMLDAQDVEVVVIRKSPRFSRPVEPELLARMGDRFPYQGENAEFRVYWRQLERHD